MIGEVKTLKINRSQYSHCRKWTRGDAMVSLCVMGRGDRSLVPLIMPNTGDAISLACEKLAE